MECLVLTYGDDVRRFPMPARDAVIGSSSGSDIVAPFPGVSRRHARLSVEKGDRVLVDLGSKNGLVVAGERKDKVALALGATVRIGRATLQVLEGSTSDLEIALATAPPRRKPPSDARDTSSGETSPGESSPSLAGALRLIRELESAGERLGAEKRAHVLASVRHTLGVETVLLVENDGGETGVVSLEGLLPDDDAVGEIVRAAPRARKQVLAETLSGRRVLVRASGRGPARIFAAIAAADAEPFADWHRELVDLVADRLLPKETRRSVKAHDAPREAVQAPLVFPPEFVPGDSPAMHGLLTQLRATVKSGMDVLILGETGTGKELFAKTIHMSGPAAGGPFVAINCAAIPSELLESELFGVQGRVATGVDPRPGLFAAADGGSIFLDEIGDMPEPLQAKMLRVLQTREVLALGSTTPKKVDVQIISASNKDLARAVKEGKFRADLYYRLRGLQFHLPPLRERREDIPKLLLAFISRAAEEYGKNVKGASRKAVDLLMSYSWPGNIRELESEVKRAVLVCPEGGLIGAEHFGAVRWGVEMSSGTTVVPAPPEPSRVAVQKDDSTLRMRVEAVERVAIADAMRIAGGNKTIAARILGITRNGLALKLKRLRA